MIIAKPLEYVIEISITKHAVSKVSVFHRVYALIVHSRTLYIVLYTGKV